MSNQTLGRSPTGETPIEHIVMRRVTRIYFLRPLMSASTLAAFVFALSLWGIAREVWVARVIENMPHAPSAFALGQFWLAAFTHTRSVVQVLTLCALCALLYAIQRFVRSLYSLSYIPA